jgi:hypothetical protein
VESSPHHVENSYRTAPHPPRGDLTPHCLKNGGKVTRSTNVSPTQQTPILFALCCRLQICHRKVVPWFHRQPRQRPIKNKSHNPTRTSHTPHQEQVKQPNKNKSHNPTRTSHTTQQEQVTRPIKCMGNQSVVKVARRGGPTMHRGNNVGNHLSAR